MLEYCVFLAGNGYSEIQVAFDSGAVEFTSVRLSRSVLQSCPPSHPCIPLSRSSSSGVASALTYLRETPRS